MKATKDHVKETAEKYGVEIEEVRPEINIVNAKAECLMYLHIIGNLIGSISGTGSVLAHITLLMNSIIGSLTLIEIGSATLAFP
jgi:hypothetical protein